MKTLNLEQMEAVKGGKINYHTLACSVGIGLVFGIAAMGGPVGVAAVALAVTSGGAFLCAAFYD